MASGNLSIAPHRALFLLSFGKLCRLSGFSAWPVMPAIRCAPVMLIATLAGGRSAFLER